MRESTINQAVNRRIAKLRPDWVVWKLNTRFQRGVPDNYYAGPGSEWWVEFKFLAKPPQKVDLRKLLSNHQQLALEKLATLDVATGVVLATPEKFLVVTGTEWSIPIYESSLIKAKHVSVGITDALINLIESTNHETEISIE